MHSNLMEDKISQKIVEILKKSNEPLETMEIVKATKGTRAKVLYRLMNLRGEGKIHGKSISSGAKGVWIWWEY